MTCGRRPGHGVLTARAVPHFRYTPTRDCGVGQLKYITFQSPAWVWVWEHSRPQIELLGWSPRSSPYTLTSVSRLAMTTVFSLVLSLFAIFLVQLLLRLRKVVRSFRSVCFPSPSRPI